MDQRQYKNSSKSLATDKARAASAPAPSASGPSASGPSASGPSASGPSLGKTTTRIELLDAVYTACPSLSRAQARDVFEITLEEIVAALLREEAVKLRSFGAFHIRSKRERLGRNPRTGVEAKIEARRVLTFRPSPTLIARVNGEPAA